MALLEARNLRKTYRLGKTEGVEALRGVDVAAPLALQVRDAAVRSDGIAFENDEVACTAVIVERGEYSRLRSSSVVGTLLAHVGARRG